jgi:RNA polymerase sigma-70 factor (ECF subfamily)
MAELGLVGNHWLSGARMERWESVVDEEAELIGRVRLGDHEAFGDLLRPHLDLAMRVAYGYLLDRCAAQDCVQEASMRAWLRIENVTKDRPFGRWFLGIVRRRCLEALRNPSSRVMPTPDPIGSAPWADGRQRSDPSDGDELRRAMAALPPPVKAAIILFYYHDLPYDEVARLLGTSVIAVKWRLRRGKERLRRILGPERW